MLNERIKNALYVLNQEVNSINKSTERYKVLHEIRQELESINKGKWVLERERTIVEKAIAKFISERYGKISEEDVLINLHLSQTEVMEKFHFDSLDWLEMIMELEEEFNVEVDLYYEKQETKLYELAEHIKLMM